MPEEKKPATEEKKCFVCQATSEEAVLICALKDNRPAWVCVHCLPILIHGSKPC